MLNTYPAGETTIRGAIDVITIPLPKPKILSPGQQVQNAQIKLDAQKRTAKPITPDPPPPEPVADPPAEPPTE